MKTSLTIGLFVLFGFTTPLALTGCAAVVGGAAGAAAGSAVSMTNTSAPIQLADSASQ